VKWSGTPAKPDAIGFTDTIKVNGTSMSVSVPISVSVTESGGSVKRKVTTPSLSGYYWGETYSNCFSAEADRRGVALPPRRIRP
jgi:hypothetical protein